MDVKSKVKYFSRSLLYYFKQSICPNCGTVSKKIIDRKYIISRLFECPNCNLYFRHPTDSLKINKKFYQKKYTQQGGFTTDLPSIDQLEHLLDTNFENTEKSVKPFIHIFSSLFNNISGKKIIDYGASWGYMSYQFKKNNLIVQSYEISTPRAQYGEENLKIEIRTEESTLTPENDLFFSSHVIEHHPEINSMIKLSRSLLKNDGYFIAECPNGSLQRKNSIGSLYKLGWGLVHPNYLNEKFYQKIFYNCPYYITSSPYNLQSIKDWNKQDQIIGNLRGDNLLIISLPNKTI